MNILFGYAKKIVKFFKKKLRNKKINWLNLRTVKPISGVFGFDRGTPIDRVYIDDFLKKNKPFIQGVACEIANDEYCQKYAEQLQQVEILHYTKSNKKATIIGDLTATSSLPSNIIDCFIITQTLNFIYDFQTAIQGIHCMLRENGVALVTVSGISQISRYDMDRWGDYWRFTDLSIKKAFENVFGYGNVKVETYGNVLSSTAFLHGIEAEALTNEELFYTDRNYQLTIAIQAVKK